MIIFLIILGYFIGFIISFLLTYWITKDDDLFDDDFRFNFSFWMSLFFWYLMIPTIIVIIIPLNIIYNGFRYLFDKIKNKLDGYKKDNKYKNIKFYKEK